MYHQEMGHLMDNPPFSSLRPKGTQLRWENHTQWTP